MKFFPVSRDEFRFYDLITRRIQLCLMHPGIGIGPAIIHADEHGDWFFIIFERGRLATVRVRRTSHLPTPVELITAFKIQNVSPTLFSRQPKGTKFKLARKNVSHEVLFKIRE